MLGYKYISPKYQTICPFNVIRLIRCTFGDIFWKIGDDVDENKLIIDGKCMFTLRGKSSC